MANIIKFGKPQAQVETAGTNDNTQPTPPPAGEFKKYHIYHRYEDIEEDFFEVDGILGVSSNFIAVALSPTDIRFVMPIDALKFAEVVNESGENEIVLEPDVDVVTSE